MTPRRRPKLELRFDPESNDRVVVETGAGVDTAHVRLRVANGKGKDTADDVVVMVTEVHRLEDSGTPMGLPLTWSGSSPPLTVAAVHPGSERHIDLLHVDLPTRDEIDVAARLDLTPKPAGSRDVLRSGRYEVSVEIRARNADAICYVVPIFWDGTASRVAVWDHLRVGAPHKVR